MLAFEPPDRVVFSWDISPHRQIETDPEKTSEVGSASSPRARTAHARRSSTRNPDRHGEGWEGLRSGVDSGDGWPLYLRGYADVVAG